MSWDLGDQYKAEEHILLGNMALITKYDVIPLTLAVVPSPQLPLLCKN